MARFVRLASASIAALLLSSCAAQRAPTRAPAPAVNLQQVLADPAVDRITRGLQSSGFELKAANVSRIALLADAPGAAFAVAGGALHIHAYRDEASAAAAVQRIISAPAGRYSWPFPPIFYQCGSAIAMYAASAPSGASALRQLCASPFYVHPSLREHSAELLAEGPGELRSQVSRLDARRRQITAQVRRKARRMAGGAKCASIQLPASAFAPVEITGDSTPELAVALSQLSCPAGAFIGPAGGTVQFWSTASRAPRLILERQILGFTPRDHSLVTLEPGARCGPALAAQCIVTYMWNPNARMMVAAARLPIATSGWPAIITFDHQLTRRALGTTAR